METFEIEFTKEVVFTTAQTEVTHRFKPGDRVLASCDAGHYFIVPGWGGIYKTEAMRIEECVND